MLGVTVPKLESVYQGGKNIESTLRRSTERFAQKFSKMMELKPLRTRKPTDS